MTPDPVCAVTHETVEEVARSMKSEDVGAIPVVDSHKTKSLVGVVTDRDLAMKVIAEGRDIRSTRVEDVMSRDPVTVRPDDDLDEALRLMADHQVRRIPVVDDQRRILGILAQADVAVRAADPRKTGEVVEEISR
jgi:CBS domain-containing protein